MRTNFPPKNEKDFNSFVLKTREMKYDANTVDVRIKYTMEYGYIYVWRYRYKKTRKFLGIRLNDKWKPIWKWTIYCGREGNKDGYDPTNEENWHPQIVFSLENVGKAIKSIHMFKELWKYFELEENYMKAEEDGSKFFRNKKSKEDILKKYEISFFSDKLKEISEPQQDRQKPEPYFYCKYGGTMPLCSDCKRNHNNSSFKTEEITTWYAPSNGTKHCVDYIQQEQPEMELNDETFIKEFRAIRDKCFNEGIEGWQREKLIARHFFALGRSTRKEE